MLQGRYLSVMEAQTVEDFRSQVVEFAGSLGFETASAMVVIDHSLTQTEFHVVDNTPQGYVEGFNNIGLAKFDPVMQHCKTTSIPIIWDRTTYIGSGREDLWEEQAAHGLRNGIAVAVHLPADRHFFMGLDRSQSLAKLKSRDVTRIVADLQLFAVHALEAAFAIFTPPEIHGNRQRLTPRELEALRWTMDGKTALEVSDALKISERTAVFHLRNAMQKLGCVSKHQAVLKAIRLGLLS